MAEEAAAEAATADARAARMVQDAASTEDDSESDHLVGDEHLRAGLEGYLATHQEFKAQTEARAAHEKPARATGGKGSPMPKKASRAKALATPHGGGSKAARATRTPPKPRAKAATKEARVKKEPAADPSASASTKRKRGTPKPVSAKQEPQPAKTGRPVTVAAQEFIVLFEISDVEETAAESSAAAETGHTPVATKQEAEGPAAEDAKHQPLSPDTSQVGQLTAVGPQPPESTEDALHQSIGGQAPRRPEEPAERNGSFAAPEERLRDSPKPSARPTSSTRTMALGATNRDRSHHPPQQA